jgi:hypothetical protein
MITSKKEKHHPHLKGKFWGDRLIEHALEFESSGTFGAFYSAENYLKELGYTVGRMCGNEPVGFSCSFDHIAKWKNLNATDKKLLDGVIIPQHDFREGGNIILFFNPPRY